MKKRKLGIIGGSGLYNIEGFENEKWKKVKTAWGEPSGRILTPIHKGLGQDSSLVGCQTR